MYFQCIITEKVINKISFIKNICSFPRQKKKEIKKLYVNSFIELCDWKQVSANKQDERLGIKCIKVEEKFNGQCKS